MTTQEFFYDSYHTQKNYFDEGTISFNRTTDTSTGSIDTSDVDQFRQGVELTQLKHFDAGVVKIHAGEQGHCLKQNRLGMGDRRWSTAYFSDRVGFDVPVASGSMRTSILLYSADNGCVSEPTLDGAIEPLTLRYIDAHPEKQGSVHLAKGCIMGGNVDTTAATSMVVTIYSTDENNLVGFYDVRDAFERSTTMVDVTANPAFVDRKLTRNAIPSSSYDNALELALVPMTGSTDNYVSTWQRSSTCGWTYDGNNIGTDSIAFGGLVY